MKNKFQAVCDFRNYSLGIYEIKFIKDINKDYILGSSKLIWKYGDFQISDLFSKSRNFFRNENLKNSVEDCIPKLYEFTNQFAETLKQNKENSLENVKLAEEILKEEKITYENHKTEFKKKFQHFKNLNLEKLVKPK